MRVEFANETPVSGKEPLRVTDVGLTTDELSAAIRTYAEREGQAAMVRVDPVPVDAVVGRMRPDIWALVLRLSADNPSVCPSNGPWRFHVIRDWMGEITSFDNLLFFEAISRCQQECARIKRYREIVDPGNNDPNETGAVYILPNGFEIPDSDNWIEYAPF